jgi:hypothetical protein
MGDPRAAVSSSPTRRWTWPATEGHARRFERSPVGASHRRPVARPARSISAVPNMSSPLSSLATQRPVTPRLTTTGRRPARSRETRSQRGVHRCQLQLGEKRGSAVGPTRRGKGSKIMAIGDGHGLPLAIHVASASPHEVTLVDATLAARFLRELPTRLIGDKGYDSDRLDQYLAATYGIELIACPARRMAGPCGAAGAAGQLSGSSPGFITSVASSRAGNGTRITSSG